MLRNTSTDTLKNESFEVDKKERKKDETEKVSEDKI